MVTIAMDDVQFVEGGVYDITGLDYIECKTFEVNEDDEFEFKGRMAELIEKFMQTHSDWVIADGYQQGILVMLSEMPKEPVDVIGRGFNNGTLNIIEDCPQTVLILAEND